MRVAINLFLTSPKSRTGAFYYIENLLPALLAAGSEHTFYLVGEQASVAHFRRLCARFPNARFYASSMARDFFVHPLRAVKKVLAKVRRDGRAREAIVAEEISAFITRERISLYFSPASLYPRGIEGVAIVTTIHDLQPEYFPENFSPLYLTERKKDYAYAIAHSRRLIAISEFTRTSLKERYGVSPEKVSVVYHAPRHLASGATVSELPDDFVFYPAALWPHKNHRVLIETMALLKDRFPLLRAVCAGMKKGGALKEELESLAESKGLNGRVLFLGFISDEELATLYARAKVLVFPSAFEGFGLPLVEAMQFGVPVVAARNSSITEIVGDAGLLVPTGDANALADAIVDVLTDNRLREDLVRKGRERIRNFSWEKAARETLEVFQSVSSR